MVHLGQLILAEVTQIAPVYLRWVKGHSNSYGNRCADSLASDAAAEDTTTCWLYRAPVFASVDWGLLRKLSLFLSLYLCMSIK